jgi:hypothetical protein
MKKVFDVGKIDINGTGRRINAVTVEAELKDTDKGPEFTASADVWNGSHTDIVMGGQCLDELAKYIHTPEFKKILRFWRLYHLNGMHPECEHQHALGWAEKAGQKVKIFGEEKALGWLTPEEHPDGLLGRACPVCGYKYGHDWKYFPIPESDLNEIRELLK